MDKILHGWYTFVTGTGIDFIPSSNFYQKLITNKINYCNICYILSKKNIEKNSNIYCLECKKHYK